MKHFFACIIVVLVGLQLMASCARTTTSGSKQVLKYQEDLTPVRPHYSYKEAIVKPLPEPQVLEKTGHQTETSGAAHAVNAEVNAVLDTLSKQNRLIKYISGFRIQIYSGSIRSQAESAKTFVYQNFPNLIPYITYDQPTYRVKVGDFMYRSDAEAYLNQIKDQYGSAVILADKVEIKKGFATRHASK